MKLVYRQVKNEENKAQSQCAMLNNCACDESLETQCYKKNITKMQRLRIVTGNGNNSYRLFIVVKQTCFYPHSTKLIVFHLFC